MGALEKCKSMCPMPTRLPFLSELGCLHLLNHPVLPRLRQFTGILYPVQFPGALASLSIHLQTREHGTRHRHRHLHLRTRPQLPRTLKSKKVLSILRPMRRLPRICMSVQDGLARSDPRPFIKYLDSTIAHASCGELLVMLSRFFREFAANVLPHVI